MDVRGAYVHDLREGARSSMPIDPEAISAAERTMTEAARRLRERRFTPRPGERCGTCEMNTVCGAAAYPGRG